MEKMDGRTKDIVKDNVSKLKQLFPEIFVEGKVSIDEFRKVIGEHANEDSEKYNLTWSGKSEAHKFVEMRSTGTLRPCKEESEDWKSSKNIFIEGDNLEVLKLLQKSYSKKIKMIYIDPPYNTGNDFIYKDDYMDSIKNYKKITGQIDGNGRSLSNNMETNGRYHTDWLNMMYPRLKLARSLLSDDGAIFISIDDNEQANLKHICNEIYGEENFISQLVWEKKRKGAFLSKTISSIKEYVIVYSKNKEYFNGLIGEIKHDEETYPCINESNKKQIITVPKGIISKYPDSNYTLKKGDTISARTMELILHSDLVIEDGRLAQDLVIEGNWRYTQENMAEFANDGDLFITRSLHLRRIVREPRYKTLKDLLPRVTDCKKSSSSSRDANNLFGASWGTNEDGEEELRELLDEKSVMDFPKPKELIQNLCISLRDSDAIVLDFFAGSATTAHAVMDLNSQDDGNRRYILVQLPEQCDEESDAGKAGFDTIVDIGKKRIKKAVEKIKEEHDSKHQTDFGFKFFRLDSSNYKPWDQDLDWEEFELKDYADNVKEDRSELDILYEILLKFGMDLAVPIAELNMAEQVVFSVGNNEMLVCLSDAISLELVDGIVAHINEIGAKQTKVVFKESGFVDDVIKTNSMQVLKQSEITNIWSL